LIDDYLNETHRDNPGSGVPSVLLAPEIARSDKRTRSLTSERSGATFSDRHIASRQRQAGGKIESDLDF